MSGRLISSSNTRNFPCVLWNTKMMATVTAQSVVHMLDQNTPPNCEFKFQDLRYK